MKNSILSSAETIGQRSNHIKGYYAIATALDAESK